jgi:hypothetical protein
VASTCAPYLTCLLVAHEVLPVLSLTATFYPLAHPKTRLVSQNKTYRVNRELKHFRVVNLIEIFLLPPGRCKIAYLIFLRELNIVQLPLSRNFGLVAQENLYGPKSIDVDSAEVHFVHSVIVLAVLLSKQYNFRPEQMSVNFEGLLVAIRERSKQFTFSLVPYSRWPLVELAGFWRHHLNMQLHNF